MTFAELPSWLRYRTGKRPIVLVAPHGGERAREIRRGDGMNDLYTAELCHELAGRLDAYAVVNEGLDRNDVDLLGRSREIADGRSGDRFEYLFRFLFPCRFLF